MATLHDAVRRKKHKLIRQLVEAGHDLNALGDEGCTPLHLAVGLHYFDIAETLVNLGAQVDAPGANGLTPLAHAARDGGLIVIRKLIVNFHANPNQVDHLGTTLVYIAAEKGQVGAILLLAELGASVDTPSVRSGTTPLYIAAQQNQVEAIRALVSLGAGLDTPRNGGGTPLGIAATNGHLEAIRELAGLGASLSANKNGETPIYIAARYNRVEAILLLARLGVDPSAAIPGSGQTPLMMAARCGHVEAIHALVSLGVCVDMGMPGIDTTALHLAITGGHVKAVRALIALGANPYASEKDTSTYFYLACSQPNREDLIVALLDNPNYKKLRNLYMALQVSNEILPPHWSKSDAARFRAAMERELPHALITVDNPPEKLFMNPLSAPENIGPERKRAIAVSELCLAASSGALETICKSVESLGGNPNVVDHTGVTPIYLAVINGRLDAILLLVELGAHVKARNQQGDTLICSAAQYDQAEAILLLAKLGVDPSAAAISGLGQTPLIMAALHGHTATIRALGSLGVLVDTSTATGKTALQFAVLEGHVEAIRALMNLGASPYISADTTSTILHCACDTHPDRDDVIGALLENPNYTQLRNLYMVLEAFEEDITGWNKACAEKFKAAMERELPHALITVANPPEKLFMNPPADVKRMSSALFFKSVVASDENRNPQRLSSTTAPRP